MNDFVADGWDGVLRANGLDRFEALWSLEAEWFEPPNRRRGGWSGVARIELPGPDGQSTGLFLKRQENHTRRTFRHPLHGEPTFAAEIRNILSMQRAQVYSLEPVYYAQRKLAGKWCVVLITRELLGYRPLDAWADDWYAADWTESRQLRLQVISECALILRRLHRAGFAHNAMHPKHIFLRVDDRDGVEARLIDLEKMRRKPGLLRRTLRDLDSLNRRSRHWSRTDRLRFLKAYLAASRLDAAGRRLWYRLAQRYLEKVGTAVRHSE
jgi:hypothetical protein